MKALAISQVKDLTGLSRATIWRLEQSGQFPKRLQLGPRRVGWVEAEIESWIESRPRLGDEEMRVTL